MVLNKVVGHLQGDQKACQQGDSACGRVQGLRACGGARSAALPPRRRPGTPAAASRRAPAQSAPPNAATLDTPLHLHTQFKFRSL